MKRAESKMSPVLAKFKDQVLFLKHNLNAQAIASLKSELGTVESNIHLLIKEMGKAAAKSCLLEARTSLGALDRMRRVFIVARKK